MKKGIDKTLALLLAAVVVVSVVLIYFVQSEDTPQDCVGTYDAKCVMDNAKNYGYVLPPGTTEEDVDRIGEAACEGIANGRTKEDYVKFLATREYSEQTAEKMVDLLVDAYCPA